MKIIRYGDRWRMLGAGGVVNDSLESLALRRGYRVGAVCEELGVCERYLYEIFLRDLGLTPKEWMQWERMVVARRMLAWGFDPMDLTEILGFSNPNSFRREFHGVYGVSPRRFLRFRLPEHS